MDDPDTRRLGRYELVRVLGKGSMGAVYEGLDPGLNRKVAIKTILKGALDGDAAAEYRMRFLREARICARLVHPHIVQVYDFGEEGEVMYLVMELVAGRELKAILEEKARLEPPAAVQVMRDLLDALQAAHEHGIIHRDVKPANVFITQAGTAKLADFGVARMEDNAAATERTDPGTLIGTPAYMSPEQIVGGTIDGRTDLFSAGIVLYQLLTGEKPFTGAGAWTIAKKIIQDEPMAPSKVNPALPGTFDAVVQRALAKDPERRFATAREFSTALQGALQPAARTTPTQAGAARPIEPYAGDGPFIFASYKREDFERISPILQQVHDAGFRVWYDKGIPGGAEWRALLEERLEDCAMLIFFMSRASVDSKHCRSEITYVDSLDKPILCIRLEEAELKRGLKMLLTQYQMIDATAEGFADEIARALKFQRLL